MHFGLTDEQRHALHDYRACWRSFPYTEYTGQALLRRWTVHGISKSEPVDILNEAGVLVARFDAGEYRYPVGNRDAIEICEVCIPEMSPYSDLWETVFRQLLSRARLPTEADHLLYRTSVSDTINHIITAFTEEYGTQWLPNTKLVHHHFESLIN